MAIVYKNQEIGFVKKINFDDKASKVELFFMKILKNLLQIKVDFIKNQS
jgi:hypothetical protein